MLLGTPVGTIDLRTGDLRAADQSDGITKTTAVAAAETADCPSWLAFLNDATGGDADLIRFLQDVSANSYNSGSQHPGGHVQSLGFVSTAVRHPGFAIRGRSLSYRGGTRPARGTRRVSGGDSGRCTRCFAIIK